MARAWLFAAGTFLGALCAAAEARAADPADKTVVACAAASERGQELRDAGKYRAAREALRQCAAEACPAPIRRDCMQWLGEVDQVAPTVVLVVREADGRELEDVRVLVDGDLLTEKLDGKPVVVDTGSHVFRFERAGSAPREERVIIHAGEKNRMLGVQLAPHTPALAGATAKTPEAPATSTSTGERPVPVATWVLGGVGVLGLASFGVFGTLGLSARSSDRCDTGCSPSSKDGVDTKFLVADASLGVGVVALGVATWLYLTRPAVAASSSRLVDVRTTRAAAPAFGASF